MKKPRRNHSAAFKARVAMEVIRGEKTVADTGRNSTLQSLIVNRKPTDSSLTLVLAPPTGPS